jgi:hypothetical protein
LSDGSFRTRLTDSLRDYRIVGMNDAIPNAMAPLAGTNALERLLVSPSQPNKSFADDLESQLLLHLSSGGLRRSLCHHYRLTVRSEGIRMPS